MRDPGYDCSLAGAGDATASGRRRYDSHQIFAVCTSSIRPRCYPYGMAGESARDRARRARAKAERLARYAEHWEKGADGESQTAAALGRLGREWTCWHDLRWPGRRLANIDHIAIGPGGIFVIDSKNWSGTVAIKDGVLRQNGYQRETAVASCAESALAVGELVPEYSNAVKPVLCFVREEPIEGWARDVMLSSTLNLVEMLTSRPRLLSDAQVADISTRLGARVSRVASSGAQASTAARVLRRVPAGPPLLAAPPATSAGRRRLPRFFVGLGIWFCFMTATGAILSAVPAHSDDLITPASLAAGVVSWLLARRIVR